MSIWYKVNATEQGITDFLDCNWGFHDFRIERVSFIPRSDTCEVFLKYDTGKVPYFQRPDFVIITLRF